MRKTTPTTQAAAPSTVVSNAQRWKLSALAAAILGWVGLFPSEASALALGRLSVQSALGEPLRAEIEVPQITPTEFETLRTNTASPDIFRAQGMEYSPVLNSLQVQVQRRPGNRAILRLSTERPISEPFMDLVLDASWNTGRLLRSYTLLLDPPTVRGAAPSVTATPQIPAAPAAPSGGAPTASPPPATPRLPGAATLAAPPGAARPSSQASANAATAGVTVQRGDTASRIANTYRPAGVSLDQMLVALMRANPDAFIAGDVNRIKAGALLQMPDAATAQATPPEQARQLLTAQSTDFDAFRRKLATVAPAAEVAAPGRTATGSVQTRVEDQKTTTATPDKLTLSRAAVEGQKLAEDQLAREKQARETSARMGELSKNITELNQLNAATTPALNTPEVAAGGPGATGSAPQAAPGVPVAGTPTGPSETTPPPPHPP
ncbi:MAG: hypothetical protein PHI55_13385, partial [Burkholderiaceae bacterium]|nr:hypothetical protein [Burkholderiaceae bacterium]